MKRLVITLAVTLVAYASTFAQKSKTTVWEYPTVGYTHDVSFTFNKVEFAKKKTSVYLTAEYPSDYWFMFSPNTYIEVDGKRYTIISGDSIELGNETFTNPETWKKNFVLHFPRLPKPKKIKSFNLMESTNKGDFKFYAIHPKEATLPAAEVPAEFRADYPEDDVLPKIAEYGEEPVKIHYKALNWQEGMEAEVKVTYLDLETADWAERWIRFDDNGCAEFSARIYYPMKLTSRIQFRNVSSVGENRNVSFPVDKSASLTKTIVAPGKEITILVDMLKETTNGVDNNFVGFKGYLSKMCRQYNIGYDSILYASLPKFPMNDVKAIKTVDEFKRVHDRYIQKLREWETVNGRWHRSLASSLQMEARLFENIANNNMDLFMSKGFMDYILTSRPKCFFGDEYFFDPEVYRLCPLISGTDVEGFIPDICRYFNAIKKINNGQLVEKPLIYDTNLSKLYDRVAADRIAEIKKVTDSKDTNIHLQDEIGNIAPTDLLQYIIDKHKGKTILIDMWEVSCGPCRLGHKEMAPMKDEEKYKDVVFVYLTWPLSDFNQWMEMTKDIPGEHYFLSDLQFKCVTGQSGINISVPEYMIINAKGEKTFEQIGWHGVETIRTALDEAMK